MQLSYKIEIYCDISIDLDTYLHQGYVMYPSAPKLGHLVSILLNCFIQQGDELMTYCKYDTMKRKYAVRVSVKMRLICCDSLRPDKMKRAGPIKGPDAS